jgi:two-component system chemotaxis response regulator CheY
MASRAVLIVENKAAIRTAIKSALTEVGFEVIEAEDGERALHHIKYGGGPHAIDAIICDLCVPNVNGLEAIAYFRCEAPSIPVLALVQEHCNYRASKLFKKGVMDYLQMPLDMNQLTAVIIGICQHTRVCHT